MPWFWILRWAALGLCALALTIVQVSFIRFLPSPWYHWPVVWLVCFFVLLVVEARTGFILTVASGVFLEWWSPLVPGSILLPWLISALIVNWLFKTFFTNRSLVSLTLLSAVAVLTAQLLTAGILVLAYWLKLSWYHWELSWDYGIATAWRLGWMVVGQSLLFLSARVFSRRVQSVFLLSGRR